MINRARFLAAFRIAFAFALGALLLCAGNGCAKRRTPVEEGNQEQILHVGNLTEPTDLDPHVITSQQDANIVLTLMEGLTTPDPKDLHPTPGVAEKWEVSPDALVYTFHLRANAKWSDGSPVTSGDFLYAYRRILSPGLGSEYSYMHYAVKNAEAFNKNQITDFKQVGFETPDPLTLRVTLNYPTPYFLSLISHQSWFPVQQATIEKYGKIDQRSTAWTRPGHYVGNGPFQLKEWKTNQIIIVERNPNYWDAANVRLKQVRFYPIDNLGAEERGFRAGQLHVTSSIPQEKIDSYRQSRSPFLHVEPFLGTYYYRFNVTKPPLDNAKVRRALSMAIDRKQIVEAVARGGQLPAFNLVPPDTAGYLPAKLTEENLNAARKLLAEAGFPDGAGFPKMEILFNTNEGHQRIAEAIQEMWKRNLGVNVSIANQEGKVWIMTMRQLDYQVGRYAWIGDYVDPNTFMTLLTSDSGNNQTGWKNAEYDRLIEQAAHLGGNPAARLKVFQRAEALMLDEAPIMPIYFYTRCNLRLPNVQGWHNNLLDIHPCQRVYLKP